ncbi:recombinase family protein [Nocardia sp. NPDC058658]|uniref:recombinase family protein n=1 Tax=Nocardia sp. NPDC058658 TaxID=3346580 RepID=UPI00364663C8
MQDPTLSLPRQLGSCTKVLAGLPQNVIITAHFYDVESGRSDLDKRGRGTAHEQFAIPIHRDGGIADMLTEAAAPERRFDIVICESIDRIWRRTVFSTRIEHKLQSLGVALLAADEPIDLARGASPRATNVLTRRVKQGIAEWYVLEMLEKSRGGFEQHTEAGFNIGQAPYGYAAEKVPHPVPARRAEGRSKTRLAIDPVRAPVIQTIYSWRINEKLGYRAIAERLNFDLDRHPAPIAPDPSKASGKWGPTTVRDILHNPKYTGYQVWNRRASKNKCKPNPPSEWVWSTKPTHPAIIDLDTFTAALHVARERVRSRSDARPASANPHRQTAHTYRMRSYVRCELCGGKRMHGKTRKSYTYYNCQPRGQLRPDNHPPSILLPEPELLAATTEFFNTHVFGPHRRELFAAAITVDDNDRARTHLDKIQGLRRTIADTESRLGRLLLTLEERDDPTGAIFDQIQKRLITLTTERDTKQAELHKLEATAPPPPNDGVELLDQLPHTVIDVAEMPEDVLRQLCDAFALRIIYNKLHHHAQFSIDIARPTLPQLERCTAAAEMHHRRSSAAIPAGGAQNSPLPAAIPRRQ